MKYSIAMWQICKFVFYQHFFNMDIPLHRQQKLLKLYLCVLQYHTEGTVSQIFYLHIKDHTKFTPDWCFGLVKQKFRKEPALSLKEMEGTVHCSTFQRVNIPQLVGDEVDNVFVSMYAWPTFCSPSQ